MSCSSVAATARATGSIQGQSKPKTLEETGCFTQTSPSLEGPPHSPAWLPLLWHFFSSASSSFCPSTFPNDVPLVATPLSVSPCFLMGLERKEGTDWWSLSKKRRVNWLLTYLTHWTLEGESSIEGWDLRSSQTADHCSRQTHWLSGPFNVNHNNVLFLDLPRAPNTSIQENISSPLNSLSQTIQPSFYQFLCWHRAPHIPPSLLTVNLWHFLTFILVFSNLDKGLCQLYSL